jgi:long-subunit acyl-CoA synthetase (AMP-forming)
MTHRSIISGLTTYCSQDVLKFNGDDRYLSHLPLPHIMERGVSLTLFYLGALVVYEL